MKMSHNATGVSAGLTPYLTVLDASRCLDFYRAAFEAEVSDVVRLSDGTTTHAEVRVAGGRFFVHEELGETRGRSPHRLGGTTATFTLYTTDVDALFERAVAAGARVDSSPADSYWGERFARVTDPSGHGWTLVTVVRAVPIEDQRRLAQDHFDQGKRA